MITSPGLRARGNKPLGNVLTYFYNNLVLTTVRHSRFREKR